MDAEKIIEILVRLYCQKEGLILEELEIKKKEELEDKTA